MKTTVVHSCNLTFACACVMLAASQSELKRIQLFRPIFGSEVS